jgi:hypothetical protein
MANDLQQQPVKNGFFRSNLFMFLLGQVLAVVAAFGVFSFTWGQISQEAIEMRKWKSDVTSTIKRMDDEGTNASKYSIKADTAQLNQLESRLKAVEGDDRKIDVMAEKINRIDETLKEIKNQCGLKR